MDGNAVFMVKVGGQIESAKFTGIDDIYCKYSFVHGTDWTVAGGIEEGISQMCKKSKDPRGIFVWNFPLDITFKSSNPYGWPQLAVSVHGQDYFGNDVIRGYGAAHVPPISGMHRRSMSMFVPESSSLVHKLVGWMSGRRPEFVDPKMVARGEGREVTRMTSDGVVDVIFHVVTKDLKKFGYNVGHADGHEPRTLEVEPPF
ncbi:B9 domain-containing protein 1 [Ixodes scapularis]|uniref:B9 domain-containing protein 1 n=1 Tax=Ixodes scapularis TaxID=6945 RepID=UPI001A9F050B|nr:B9 domain-containing protein 1 [Ixodes scapularis]